MNWVEGPAQSAAIAEIADIAGIARHRKSKPYSAPSVRPLTVNPSRATSAGNTCPP